MKKFNFLSTITGVFILFSVITLSAQDKDTKMVGEQPCILLKISFLMP